MATRFYTPGFGTAPVENVAPSVTGWDRTATGFQRYPLEQDRTRSFNGALSGASDTFTPVAALNAVTHQFISAPLLHDQLVSGTVKGILWALETLGTADACAQMRIRICSNDGTVFRGTLLDFDNSALSNEFNISSGTLRNAKYPRGWSGDGAALTAVSASAGDRIVVDVGYRRSGLVSANVQISTGKTSFTTDAAENETDTSTTVNSWIEFSQDFLFAPMLVDPSSDTNQSKASGTSLAATFGQIYPRVGDLCVVGFASNPAAGTYTIADDAGNDWRLIKEQVNGSGTSGVAVRVWASLIKNAVSTAGTALVTVTHPTITARAIGFTTFTGVFSNVEDGVSGGNTTASPLSAGNITPSLPLCLVLGVGGIENELTNFSALPASYSVAMTAQGTSGAGAASNIALTMGHWVQLTPTQTDFPQATGSNNNAADVIVAFKPFPGDLWDQRPRFVPILAQ